MRRGDVVILSQSYSDRSASKVRPVLVVSSDLDNARLVNVIVATKTVGSLPPATMAGIDGCLKAALGLT